MKMKVAIAIGAIGGMMLSEHYTFVAHQGWINLGFGAASGIIAAWFICKDLRTVLNIRLMSRDYSKYTYYIKEPSILLETRLLVYPHHSGVPVTIRDMKYFYQIWYYGFMKFWKSDTFLKKGGTSLWIGIILIVVIVAMGLWYYLVHSTNGPMSDTFGNPVASTTDTLATSSLPATKKTVGTKTAPASRKLSTVATIAQGLPNTSQFISLFKSTGVATQITGPGPYTVFVPTNGAFSQLPSGTITKMTAAQKLRFIQYHIIVGRAIDPEAQTAGTVQALSRDALNFSFGADKIPLVNSAIFLQKYQASNGVVYLIDNVLLPPQRLQ